MRSINRSGGPCQAPARSGGSTCYLHEDRSRAVELGRRGGSAKRSWEAYRDDLPPLQTVDDIRKFLSLIAKDLCAGRLEPKRANALCYIATSLLKAIDLAAQSNRKPSDTDQSRPRSFEAAMESVKKQFAADRSEKITASQRTRGTAASRF